MTIATALRLRMGSNGWPCPVHQGDSVNNLRIYATLVDGQQLELHDCPTGRDVVRALLRDTERAKALVIEATDKEGRVVRIIVPADDSEVAKVSIALDA